MCTQKRKRSRYRDCEMSPVRVVEERGKIRIVHDMTFEHGNGSGSVISMTDWDEIPACALAGVIQ